MHEFILAMGLTMSAITARQGGLDKHAAFKALRASIKKYGLPVSNKDIRLAVNIVYKKEGK